MSNRKRSPPPSENSADDGNTYDNGSQSPVPRSASFSAGGLHHRHKPNQQQTPEQARATRQSLAEQYKERARKRGSRPRPRYAKRMPIGRWIRSCLIAGIPAYIVAAVFFVRQMTQRRAMYRSLAQLGYESSEKRYERSSKDQKEEAAWLAYQRSLEERALQRRSRHQPRETDEQYIFPYDILMSDQREREVFGAKKHKLQYGGEPAGMENVCGFLAKKASWEYNNTQAYVERDALNKDARVVITGILNPIGFQLALALKETCGVQVITGLDAMFPNTIESRLEISEQIKILHRNLPKLVKPILPTYVGGDPQRLPRKTMKTLESTGELDYASLHATHIVHLAAATPEVFRDDVNPDWKNLGSPYVEEDYDPAFYQIRSSLTSMEQILASIANMDADDRPHFVYASASPLPNQGRPTHKMDQWHSSLRLMDEVLADHYYNFHGVNSVGLRLPHNVYGPWSHSDSQVHRLMLQTIGMTNTSSTFSRADELDLVHIDDATDALVAAMQYRNPSQKPSLFDISSGGTVEASALEKAFSNMHSKDEQFRKKLSIQEGRKSFDRPVQLFTKEHLAWEHPRVPLQEGLIRTLAWHLDRANPYGPPLSNHGLPTGDTLLEEHALSTCGAEDLICNRGRRPLACASGCSPSRQCVPSLFDSITQLVQEVTEGCGIVLYTQELGREVSDLRLHSEYMEDGDPLICNFAFVSRESPLVESVIKKVPDTELKKLGVDPNFAYEGKPHEFHDHKLDKLNGRLLFRGWILLWPRETPENLPEWESSLIKLTPGALFSTDVKHTLFIDQSFNVSPSLSDIQFLVGEMHREAWPSRLVKRKQRPKAKFLLPAEPERHAILLLSELKYQDSSQSDRLPSDVAISAFEATRFMRFELGEEPMGKEPPEVKNQREFYERLSSVINRDYLRSAAEPVHKYQLSHWARTRWVLHDLELEEARQLRCDWYREHVDWGTKLDQLSFAFIMAKRDLKRKVVNGEPDESIQKAISEKTEMKKLLSDAFEWHALLTEQNKDYSPYEEMKMLPYEIDFVPPDDALTTDPSKPVALFARIISDRLMAYARKTWNDEKELEEIKQELQKKKAKLEKTQNTEPVESEGEPEDAKKTEPGESEEEVADEPVVQTEKSENVEEEQPGQ